MPRHCTPARHVVTGIRAATTDHAPLCPDLAAMSLRRRRTGRRRRVELEVAWQPRGSGTKSARRIRWRVIAGEPVRDPTVPRSSPHWRPHRAQRWPATLAECGDESGHGEGVSNISSPSAGTWKVTESTGNSGVAERAEHGPQPCPIAGALPVVGSVMLAGGSQVPLVSLVSLVFAGAGPQAVTAREATGEHRATISYRLRSGVGVVRGGAEAVAEVGEPRRAQRLPHAPPREHRGRHRRRAMY